MIRAPHGPWFRSQVNNPQAEACNACNQNPSPCPCGTDACPYGSGHLMIAQGGDCATCLNRFVGGCPPGMECWNESVKWVPTTAQPAPDGAPFQCPFCEGPLPGDTITGRCPCGCPDGNPKHATHPHGACPACDAPLYACDVCPSCDPDPSRHCFSTKPPCFADCHVMIACDPACKTCRADGKA